MKCVPILLTYGHYCIASPLSNVQTQFVVKERVIISNLFYILGFTKVREKNSFEGDKGLVNFAIIIAIIILIHTYATPNNKEVNGRLICLFCDMVRTSREITEPLILRLLTALPRILTSIEYQVFFS